PQDRLLAKDSCRRVVEDDAAQQGRRPPVANLQQRVSAHEVALSQPYREAEAGRVRVVLRIDVGAPKPITLLESQRVHRADARRDGPERLSGLEEDGPQARAIFHWSVELPAEFADIRDPRGQDGHLADPA